MIERMRRYTFVLHRLDYRGFLAELQDLGMVHLIRSTETKTEALAATSGRIARFAAAAKLLKPYLAAEKSAGTAEQGRGAAAPAAGRDPAEVLAGIDRALEERDKLGRRREALVREIAALEPWGHFRPEDIRRLAEAGVAVDLYVCPRNRFKEEWAANAAVEIVRQEGGTVHFAVFRKVEDTVGIDADPFPVPPQTLAEKERELGEVDRRLGEIEDALRREALEGVEVFQAEIGRLAVEYAYEDALLQGVPEADDEVMIVRGWIPARLEGRLLDHLERTGVVHIAEDGAEGDRPPVLLRNGWFARQFEPISRMFMLPHYHEFDLTPFFAPFFMLFFGFCNADISYGVALIALGALLKSRMKKPSTRGALTLVQIFGAAAIVMGWLTGTVLGYDLKAVGGVGELVLLRSPEQLFNVALLLGAIQILLGVAVRTVKLMRQKGFLHGVSSCGAFLLLSGLAVMGSSMLGVETGRWGELVKYPVMAGLAMILLFNSPGKNILVNIGAGLWALYNLVTGFFGDILSYIRLFALGVSSTILGIVVNAMAKDLAAVPYAGWLLFLVFMIFGHSLNLALGALGGFVHPMRLTFVEFYKNAGFDGPGLEYRPFGKLQSVK
jgi:V/A-type H+/Na+-transporting ATPase subunit I